LIAGRLSKLLGLQGRVKPSLEEYVIPTIQVADLAQGGLPPVTRRCVIQFDVAGVVGEVATVSFEVPGGVLAVLRNLKCNSAADANLLMFVGSSVNTAGFTEKSGVLVDGRLRATESESAATFVFGTQAGALAQIDWRMGAPAGISLELIVNNLGWAVGSGRPDQFGFMEFQLESSNTTGRFTVEWDEYQIF